MRLKTVWLTSCNKMKPIIKIGLILLLFVCVGLLNVSGSTQQFDDESDWLFQKAWENIFWDTELFEKATKGLEKKIKNSQSVLPKLLYLKATRLALDGRTFVSDSIFNESLRLAIQFHDTDLVILTKLEIANSVYNQGGYDSAFSIFTACLNDCYSTKRTEYLSTVYQHIGKYYHTIGQSDKSLINYQLAESWAKTFGQPDKMASIMNNLGNHYESLGNYQKSLDYYLKSLQMQHQFKDKVVYGTTYNHLGSLYLTIGEYEKAIDFFIKSLSIRQSIQYTEGIGKSMKNIGEYFEEIANLDSATVYYKNALAVFNSTNYRKGKNKMLVNLGRMSQKNGNYRQGLNYLLTAIRSTEEVGYDKGSISASFYIGQLYNLTDNSDSAIFFLDYCISRSTEVEYIEYLNKAHWEKYLIYKKLNNSDLALLELEKFQISRELLFNEKQNKYIARLQVEHDIATKSKENELLKNQNELKEQLLQKKKTQMAQLVFIVVLTGVLIVVLILLFLDKQKANLKLISLNKQIIEQNNTLEKLNKELQYSNNQKDRFFSIIAHELRNPLWWFRNMTEILNKSFDQLKPELIKKSLKSIEESAQNAFHLTDNLLQWSRNALNRIETAPRRVVVKSLVDKTLTLLKASADYKGITIKEKVPSHLTAFIDEELFNTVLRNLLSNALKYTPEKGTITIIAKDIEPYIEIQVSDNGIGINSENQTRLFDDEQAFTTLGISNEKGSGIGLILCKEFVLRNGGQISVESEPEKGTTFTFTIPKYEPFSKN